MIVIAGKFVVAGQICDSWAVFLGGWNKICPVGNYIIYCRLFRDRVKEVFYGRKAGGELLGYFFKLYTTVAPPIYVPTPSFKLMALRNIMVEETLLSKIVTMKQTSCTV